MNFKQYILREFKYGNKYYLFIPKPIEEVVSDRRFMGRNPGFLRLRPYHSYKLYKKRIGSESEATYSNNYIYKIIPELRIFSPYDERDVSYAHKNELIHPKFYDYFGLNKDQASAREVNEFFKREEDTAVKLAAFGHWMVRDAELYKPFAKKWDGYLTDDRDTAAVNIFWGKFDNNDFELIDGTKTRFHKGREVEDFDIEIPKHVNDALETYTDEPQKRIAKNAKEWMKDNLPAEDVTAYRGTSANWDSWDHDDLTEEEVNKKLKRRFNITLEEAQTGNEVIVRRYKSSSWSTDPQIARNFVSGMGEASINLLVKATIPADQIVIDFTKIPLNIKKQFKYFAQNEIIVDGTVDAVINDIWVYDKFEEEVLNKFGYEYVKQRGIFKIQ